MSQDALAEALGVSRQTISNWENDKAILDAEKLQRLCALFCVSIDEFLNGDGVFAEKASPAPEKMSPIKRKRWFLPAVFAMLAVAFLVAAVLGLLFSDWQSSEASISLYPSAVWGGFFVLGGCALVAATILFFKKK